MKGTLEWNEDYNYYWVPSTGSWVIKEKKVKPQDTPAICKYSGLRPIEGYKEEEIDKKEETPEEKAYRMGWINGYEEGANDKETNTKIGDIDFMYKWIRSKSGK